MTKQKILNLLDMSETEAYAILHENEITSFDQDNSLPDLAFRLRDEVEHEKYKKAVLEIFTYQCRSTYPDFVISITPTEMITAALLAGLENENE